MTEVTWEGPIIELSRPMTAYLLWLVARDLREWDDQRRSRLDREEAEAFAAFISDFLPPEMRTEIAPAAPMLRAG